MTLTIDAPTTEIIDLPECFNLLEQLGDLEDPNNLQSMALCLKMLANNKSFLVEFVNEELNSVTDIGMFQKESLFPQQVIDLGGRANFQLRANVWPVSTKAVPDEWEQNLFAYQRPHDHDSDFMTIGYWGPGYETVIHEYDPEHVVGYAGEPVELRFLERTRLGEGKIMYYRANRDIHTQLAPSEFSVSINLLIHNLERRWNAKQFWFDIENGTVGSRVGRESLIPVVFLCKLARFLGNDKTIGSLEAVAKKHFDPKVRGTAIVSLCELDKSKTEIYQRRARDDADPYVRRVAETLQDE